MRRSILSIVLLYLFLLCACGSAGTQQWKFAVMADTQWAGADDGRNPGTTSVDIIRALNKEFINHKVKFVVQVGDLVDQTGSTTTSIANSEDIRAAFAQELYNAGIGFFPLRGNHDSRPLVATEFRRIYPQTLNGKMNVTPADVFSSPNADATVQPFPTVSGGPFFVGGDFSTPGAVSDPATQSHPDWTGLSYAFEYQNARFILLDQFTPLNATASYNPYPNAIHLQQPWIDSVLASKGTGAHAFVFGHRGLITEGHPDTLFGSDPSQNASEQDAFITALYNAGVRYYIQGHDHIHNRSLVSVTTGTPTDGTSPKVEDILCASDSSKFYTPAIPSNDDTYNVPAFGRKRQAQIAQELYTVGYYIFTVDGPRVTAEYYSAQVFPPNECCDWLLTTTPTLDFTRKETFGYSLNGKEFHVCQSGQANCNSSYTQVADGYRGTAARILSGTNTSTAVDFDNRNFVKTVNTGWSSGTWGDQIVGDIFTLWGMSDLGTDQADTYTLSMDSDNCCLIPLTDHPTALLSRGPDGRWINAVDLNKGSYSKQFILGPWKQGYELGTYGYDPGTKAVWAVINYNGNFAVGRLGG